MGKIVVSTNVSLDGVVQDPDGQEGFRLGGWFVQFGGKDLEEWGKVEYDEATAKNRGEIIPVIVSVYEDRSHSLVYKTPPTSFLIRKALGIQSGASNPLTQTVGTLSATQIKEIAERKLPDLNANDIDAAIKVVGGTARSMGVKVA